MDKKIIKFVGYSESGKTTLIENIIKKLKLSGLSVVTVKHDVHGLDIDKEGKDSYRYSAAGADISVVSTKDLTVYKIHKDLTLCEILDNISDVDLIIVEGYSSDDNIPCIGVARKETGKGFKGDIKNYKFISSDYSSDELANIGFLGISTNINDIEANVKMLKEVLGI
jgi:molybdopterin-guanine dinucleotide biosynthesis protein B